MGYSAIFSKPNLIMWASKVNRCRSTIGQRAKIELRDKNDLWRGGRWHYFTPAQEEEEKEEGRLEGFVSVATLHPTLSLSQLKIRFGAIN